MLRRLTTMLPHGRTLDDERFERRHRALALLVLAHFPAYVLVAILLHGGDLHHIGEASVLLGFGLAALAVKRGRTLRSLLVVSGLLSASAILVHVTGGLIESHFHFFVVLGLISLYEDWVPFGAAVSYVVVHHGLAGMLMPEAVYNHPAAQAEPVVWALVHAAFVGASCVAYIVAWRLNELTRARLSEAVAKLDEAQHVAGVGSFSHHPGAVDEWSDELHRLCGRGRTEITPGPESFLGFVHPDDRARVGAIVATALGEWIPVDYSCRMVRPDGEERHVRVRGSGSDDGQVYTGTVLDITDFKMVEHELEHSRARLEHQALHDTLTGLPNREFLTKRLAAAMKHAEREGASVGVIFLDIDSFKDVNDSLGHGAGDELLRSVGARLAGQVRPNDTIARFGGDEFVVLIESVGSEWEAQTIASRLADAFKRPFELAGQTLSITVSIGISLPAERADAEALLSDADAAMYRAKAQGRGRIVVFDEEMRDRAIARLGFNAAIRRALDNGEFRLFYQPVVSLKQGQRVEAMEALIRWQDPERGLVPPLEFIPAAEESGLIVEIGEWTIDEACRQIAEWKDVPISVNLSARQVLSRLPEVVEAALEAHQIPAALLAFEITEGVLLEPRASRVLTRLSELGCRLYLDDFGTGYSSLAYLSDFPIDTLKLDRSFLADIENDEKRAIVEAVAKMASGLGITALAEGVETSDQLDRLIQLGFDSAQGFFFAKPQSAEEIDARRRPLAQPA